MDDYPPLTRDQAIEAFKVQLRINLGQIESMLSDPSLTDSKGSVNLYEQMRVMMRVMVEKAKANDQLFEETGVEEDQLDAAIQKLGLQYDLEFMQLMKDNILAVRKKA